MYSVLSTLFVIGVFLVVAGFLGRVGTDGISDIGENVAAAIGLLVTYAFLIQNKRLVYHSHSVHPVDEVAVHHKKGKNPVIMLLFSSFEVANMRNQIYHTFYLLATVRCCLKQIPTHSLCPEDLAQLQYEIETCELHLFELTCEE